MDMEDRIKLVKIQSSLDRHKELIVSKLSDVFIDALRDKNVISREEMGCLIVLDNKSSLLKLLHFLDEKSLTQLTTFLCILEEHNADLYREVKTSVQSPEISIWKAAKNAIRSLYPVLMESLNVKDIAPMMYAAQVITWEENDQLDILTDNNSQTQANKVFFGYLRDKPDEEQTLKVLLQCLQIKQPDLFNMISGEVEKLGVTSLQEALVTAEEPETTVKKRSITLPADNINIQQPTALNVLTESASSASITEETTMDCSQDTEPCHVFTIVPIGETKTGKTSLMRTIMTDKSYLTKEGDRTIVADPLRWIPPDQSETVFMINDVGGQDAYKSTTPCFQVNCPSCLNILCHDITSNKYSYTFYWLKATQTNAQNSKTVVILTKVDQLEPKTRNNASEKFRKNFSFLLDTEIELAEDCRKRYDHQSSNWNIYTKHIQNYNSVKEQINSKELLLVSCIPGWEESVSKVRDLLLRFANNEENRLTLEGIEKELFFHVGELGIKPPLFAEQQDSQTEFMQQQFVTMKEVMHVYQLILQKCEVQTPHSLKDVHIMLTSLSEKGCFRYFADDEVLKEIIFNIPTLSHILQCIFHHQIETYLQFDTLNSHLRTKLYEDNQVKFEDDMDYLRQHGILSMSLLELLLEKSQCLVEGKVVVQLLAKLDVSIPFVADGQSEMKIFVPYFIRKVIDPREVSKMKKKTAKCQGKLLSLHTVVKNNLPPGFFYQLLVKVQRKLNECHEFQRDNFTWSKGLQANLGQSNARLFMLYNNENDIEFIIQADISNPAGHQLMWNYIRLIDSQSKEIKMARFPGLPFSYVLTCTCCLISEIISPDVWLVEKLLKSQSVETFTCKNSHCLPACLVRPVSEEEARSEDFLETSLKCLEKAVAEHAPAERRVAEHVSHPPESTSEANEEGSHSPDVDDIYHDACAELPINAMSSAEETEGFRRMALYTTTSSIRQFSEPYFRRTIDIDDVLARELELHHPALRKFQRSLEAGMKPSEELMENLLSTNLITVAQKESIDRDITDVGKIRRILLHTDNFGFGGVESLAQALQHCKEKSNSTLGRQLRKSLKGLYGKPGCAIQ